MNIAANLNQVIRSTKLNGEINQIDNGLIESCQEKSVFQQMLLKIAGPKLMYSKTGDETNVLEEYELLEEDELVGQELQTDGQVSKETQTDILANYNFPAFSNFSIEMSGEDGSELQTLKNLFVTEQYQGDVASNSSSYLSGDANKALQSQGLDSKHDFVMKEGLELESKGKEDNEAKSSAVNEAKDKSRNRAEGKSDKSINEAIAKAGTNPMDNLTGSKTDFSTAIEKSVKTDGNAFTDKTKDKEVILDSNSTEKNLYVSNEYKAGVAVSANSSVENQVQKIEGLEPYNQIGKEILSKLEQKGPMEFKFQLQPKELGQIDIKMKFDSGKLMIDIIAFSSKTQTLLTSQVDKLIMSLGMQNAQVEILQGSQHSNSQSSDTGYNQQNAFLNNNSTGFSQRNQGDSLGQEAGHNTKNLNVSKDVHGETNADTSQTNMNKTNSFHRMDYIV